MRPALPETDANWRETLMEQFTADKSTNQARRERGLAQYPVADGLTVGSNEELQVYLALKSVQHETSDT